MAGKDRQVERRRSPSYWWTRAQSSIGEQRVHHGSVLHELRDVLAERGSHLESVARAAADKPDVLESRMAVDEIMAIGRRLVLAHAALDEGRTRKSRKSRA
jgi:hypothetical protein